MGSIVPAPETLTDREKSWHLLAVLLSLGRPARPAELVSRCALFHATPDLVERLCGIPGSPIFLTADLFVTASEAGTVAVVRFLMMAVALPNFESFVIENEEGSGGYGTVYRAQRKYDGKTFAIKCPHVTSYSHYVNNELKMLERFGGRNFVIKYEGSFKSGDSDCLVLEHVEHDRPEVLKRDINIFELQWYGYCMFRALSSLHKQGIVHRDVKPGNFLFSRKLNKGYLIDFNLAESKNVKKRSISHSKTFQESDNTSKFRNQNAELSGITSTKDGTSTRTPSAERTREPVPRHGRKELLSLVQEAMQSPNQKAATAPASHRKRIAAAAPPGNIDKRLILLTPMPLHSGGVSVVGAGMSKARGEGKQKREGPCVGTKGFRAPEVLLRSPHQGCKVDIWSAGVSLLYLILGKTAFFGDPEQNIREIVKLRGSEDLWEVAKIHSRESSFPMDLLDIRSLQTMELQEWCELNTKRLEFLEMIPESLFDLIDRCLVVNPRLRITAEEALMHEFFTPCHESLRKQRLLRRAISSDSSTLSLLLQ
ncbi:Cyclin-dependent kinase F-1 [Acorus gramineus]|uniref:non-specific serine/threonine protein kinase n=1 Tax=Acorus gramineus TaxID=55184 RepID=A0AAV9AEL5_ACOGR|nr:Cyclin-dependent kinase F-1 [Acorus gramineus]